VSTSNSASYYFWVERFPAEAQEEVTNFYPSPGDSVATDVYWSSSTGAEFGVCDYTLNECAVGSQASAGPDNHAEWIVERTELCENGHYWLPPLASFARVDFTQSGYDETPQGNVEYAISQGSPTLINMFDATGMMLDTTTSLSSGGTAFSVVDNTYGVATNTGNTC
jgi:hypothetical protein